MSVVYKDIDLLTQKSTIAGTEKLPVSDTEYVTPNQIAGLATGSITDVTVGGTSVVSNGVAAVPSIPSAPGTLVTNAATAQTASSGEAMSNTITLHKVAKTGTYSDLINTPTIPTVNNSTITIQMNGSTVDTFTTNASSAKTINLGGNYLKYVLCADEAAYEAIQNKDSGTLYLIPET